MSSCSSENKRRKRFLCFAIRLILLEKKIIKDFSIGAGQKNLKNLKKPEIGHYLKNNIPPKEVLFEFPVSEENILPAGE